MPAKRIRGVLSPRPGHVCLSCRLQYAATNSGPNRRYQHTDNSTNPEKSAPGHITSLTDRIRAFLSGDHTAAEKKTPDIQGESPDSPHKTLKERDKQVFFTCRA